MRKSLAILLGVVLLAAAAALVIVRKYSLCAPRVAPATLVPASTLAYLEIPDVARSLGRWQHTALHELWSEREVQDFMARPLATVPPFVTAARYGKLLEAVQPRRGFVAVTTLEGDTPHIVAGFAFTGSPAAVEALFAEGHASLRQQFPAGQAAIVPHRSAEVRTFATESMTVAETMHGGWYFTADSAAGLAAVLDRFDGRVTGGSLADNADFVSTMKPLSPLPEMLAFARLGPWQERLAAFLAPRGLGSFTHAAPGECLGFSSKIEGSVMRETLFIRTPGARPAGRQPNIGLALTTPQTVVYAEGVLPDQQTIVAALAALGVDQTPWKPLVLRLGLDAALVLDWPETASASGIVALPIRPGEGDFRELMTDTGWKQTEQDDIPVLIGEGLGPFPAAPPAMAVRTGEPDSVPELILGSSPEAAAGAAGRRGGATLGPLPAFLKARQAVPAATGLFAYVDTGTLVHRAYRSARPMLALGLSLSPATAPYMDAGKLPSAEVLSRHLGTTVTSRSDTWDGQIYVSVGALTAPQLLVVLAAGSSLAFPNLPPVPGLSPATPVPGPH